jgi:sterol desaturase/sphingolipid hydroxylase (fatty acid hydroxylase superfamily)
MQCQYCASEVEPDATECKKCGALRVIRRTTLGVFVGWAGMVVGITWIMLLVPLTFLPFLGYQMGSYPWITLIVGALITAVLLWYSRKTMHFMWVRPGE